ncbi:hypothetical protein [Chromobacterium violaceum]|uniref:hypothetical protein n=1 Tax=Chromobacterium violaceum TaxID=536 RepID=UPI0012D447C1|nr:hypothetical protein [Chromobacterium violaceum]
MNTSIWPDTGTLSTIASIIAAFGVAMLFFRIQRELQMQKRGELNWIPWADWLLLFASLLALLFVLLPLVAAHQTSWAYRFMPPSACAASIVLLAGYPIAILAHYQFIFAFGRTLPRVNPEPSEAAVVVSAVVIAIGVAYWAYVLRSV